MFKVAEPLMTSINVETVKAEKVSALNDGVKLSDVNANLAKSIMQNRAKRQRGVVHTRRAARY